MELAQMYIPRNVIAMDWAGPFRNPESQCLQRSSTPFRHQKEELPDKSISSQNSVHSHTCLPTRIIRGWRGFPFLILFFLAARVYTYAGPPGSELATVICTAETNLDIRNYVIVHLFLRSAPSWWRSTSVVAMFRRNAYCAAFLQT